jgi:serine kinase of HPr protein (carbohydrate metabolism regulator)
MTLQAISPKLMALRGHFVLHASAVLVDGAIVAFAGKSGAGKTTTARALAGAGARLLSEDKLVLRRMGGGVGAPMDCERRIMEWVGRAAADLSAGRVAACEGLDAAAAGESGPIGAVGFLAAARRSGTSFVASRLERAQAAHALFGHSFHGSDRPQDWRRHLETAVDGARDLPAFEITAPDGRAALEPAARALIGGEGGRPAWFRRR